jgi:NADH dehydrogenase subunit D (EC 1.6.5.3)
MPSNQGFIHKQFVEIVDNIWAVRNLIRTEEMVINIGPQHPSTHGVFRLVLKIEGETLIV